MKNIKLNNIRNQEVEQEIEKVKNIAQEIVRNGGNWDEIRIEILKRDCLNHGDILDELLDYVRNTLHVRTGLDQFSDLYAEISGKSVDFHNKPWTEEQYMFMDFIQIAARMKNNGDEIGKVWTLFDWDKFDHFSKATLRGLKKWVKEKLYA